VVVRADELRLGQVIRNLVENTAKYGGHQVTILSYHDGTHMRIEVIDNGRGVR
jgi:signal transduction histidine kinase